MTTNQVSHFEMADLKGDEFPFPFAVVMGNTPPAMPCQPGFQRDGCDDEDLQVSRWTLSMRQS